MLQRILSRALFVLYYLRELPGADGRHCVAAALARADVRLHQQRRMAAKGRP